MFKKIVIFILLLFVSIASYGQKIKGSSVEVTTSITLGDSTVTAIHSGTLVNEAWVIQEVGDSSWYSIDATKITVDTLTPSATEIYLDGDLIVSGITINDSIVDTVYSGTLVSKDYVDNNFAAAYTFENGLTESGGVVKIDGTLTENTDIWGDNLYRFRVQGTSRTALSSSEDVGNDSRQAEIVTNSTSIDPFAQLEASYYFDATGYSDFSRIESHYNEALLEVYDDEETVTTQFSLSDNGGYIQTPHSTGRGLWYAADYSANFDDFSLINKGFADDTYSSTGSINDIQISDGSGSFYSSEEIAAGTELKWDGNRLQLISSSSSTNTITGNEAGANITAGGNTVYGYRSARDLVGGGGNNTFYGSQSGQNATTSSNNVANGFQSLLSLSTGSGNNTASGASSGANNTNGSNNVYLGFQSGFSNSTGDRNIFIGAKAGFSETGSDNLYVEPTNSTTPLIYGDFAADSVQINGGIDVTGITKLQDKIYAYDLDTIQNEYTMYLNPTTKEVTAREATHLFSYFDVTYDPGQVLQNDWYHLTNATNDYLTTIEFKNIGGRNDSIILLQDGHYKFSFNVTFEGGNGDDYEFRFFNVTQNEAVYGTLRANSFGTGKPLSLAGISYCTNCNQFDFIVPQYRNIANNDNDFLLIGGSALIEMTHAE